jgi:DNA repair exonuclease SbcCD ATPase subunit
MKKILFEKLTIRNFLSVGERPVEINFRHGLHGITGINRDQLDRRNGVGKSTIPDALHFALFGTTIRELKKEFIINNITGKTCEVSLTFSIVTGKEVDNYEIVRTLEPSKCYLYQNQRDVTRDSIASTTEYISQLIQSNPETFQNCVIMTMNNTVPFMAKKKLEKRKFIETIFNFEIFSKMLTQLREEQSTVKKDHDIESAREEELAQVLVTLENQKKKSHQDYEDRKKLLLKRQTDNTNELQVLDKRITSYKQVDAATAESNLVKLDNKLKECDTKINEIGKQVATLETKNDFCLATLNKIGTEKEVCPTCLRSIDEHDVSHIKKSKQGYKDQIKIQENEIKSLEQRIEEVTSLKTKILDAARKCEQSINQANLQQQQLENDQKRKKQLEGYNVQVEQDLQHLTDNSDSANASIAETAEKLEAVRKKVQDLAKILNLLDTVKFVVSEEGVKSFIVKKILNLFNSKLAFYLKKLHSTAIITFNEYFEEQILNDKGKITSYFNFSGAERKAIDLATMFTFIEMLSLQGNIYYNIQFYDELLDTSLDEAGVENALRLLGDLVQGNGYGVYIISHRKECSRILSGDIIFLEKRNGITTLAKSGTYS